MAGYSGGVFTRSDGTRSGASVCQDQKAASVKVTAQLMDNELNYIKTALDTCLLKDGTQTVTANLPMTNFKLTGLGTGTARTDSASVANIQDGGALWGGTSGGSANAQTITLSPALTAYAAGQMFSFIAGFTQTSSCTLNVNALGAKNIKVMGGLGSLVNPIQGTIIVGSTYTVIYDGTQFILINPSESLRYITTIGAGGTVQSDATTFDAQFVHISGGTGGIKLPASTPGRSIFVYNITSASINVYPPVSSAIGGRALNAAAVIAPGAASIFYCYSTTAWDEVSGFASTAWTSWTPTYSASGSMTYGTVTTTYAKYILNGKTCSFQIWANGTTGGTASTAIRFTLPFTASAASGLAGGAMIVDGASGPGGTFSNSAGSSTTVVDVYKSDGTNYGLGVGRVIMVNATYEIA